MMTLQKTVEIPADHRLFLELDIPQEIPAGMAIITFTPTTGAVETTTSEAIFRPCYKTLEEVLAAGEQRAKDAEADPSLYSLKEFHGILKNSKAWGQHLDTTAIIRKMRDDWDDEESAGNANA
jgi:hypothetical protein